MPSAHLQPLAPFRTPLLALLGCAALAACGSADTDVVPDDGACGAVTEHIVSLTAKVVDGDGAAVQGATVELEDRGWDPGTTLGAGTTSADGTVELADLKVTSVERCWGTLLDYVLVASLDAVDDDKQVNNALFNAIDDGSLKADVTAGPLVLP